MRASEAISGGLGLHVLGRTWVMGTFIHFLPRMRVLNSPHMSQISLCVHFLNSESMFLVSPPDRLGQFRLWVQLCFAHRGMPVAYSPRHRPGALIADSWWLELSCSLFIGSWDQGSYPLCCGV